MKKQTAIILFLALSCATATFAQELKNPTLEDRFTYRGGDFLMVDDFQRIKKSEISYDDIKNLQETVQKLSDELKETNKTVKEQQNTIVRLNKEMKELENTVQRQNKKIEELERKIK